MRLYFPYKLLSSNLFIACLLIPVTVWSETVCSPQECSSMATKVEGLLVQINDANDTIKKLETTLSMAEQDIKLLQTSNPTKVDSKISLINAVHRTANGHGH